SVLTIWAHLRAASPSKTCHWTWIRSFVSWRRNASS
ncbi:calpain-like cysteine peptidase, putative,cysteine peptidase, Clan CA, family C2, putative, partial [Trypanosoma cruzi]